MTITYVTGNALKFEIAKRSLDTPGITLVQEKLDVPEIQSESVAEIASFSAKWAANYLEKPVVVTDAGYFITALKGFPGPFIKFINNWLSAEDILKLMKDKTDRSVTVKVCLAYCSPGKDPAIFEVEVSGTIASALPLAGNQNTTSINQIYIPDGYNKVESQLSEIERIEYWSQCETYWNELKIFLRDQEQTL